jgi:hypothetical protein
MSVLAKHPEIIVWDSNIRLAEEYRHICKAEGVAYSRASFSDDQCKAIFKKFKSSDISKCPIITP